MERKESNIKVLFTIPNFNTAGSGKALLKIAMGLDKGIFEPQIACFHNKGAFFKEVVNSGIPIHIVQYTNPMKNRIKGVFYSWKISHFFRKNRFDIIHSFHYSSDYSEALAARLAGVKWVYTKKNMNWGGASKNSWKLRTLLASAIVYQNSDMKSQFFPNRKSTFFISRGVDTSEFFFRGKNRALLKEFGIGEKEKIILCVANLVPVKGIEILIDAFRSVKESIEDIKLLIVVDNNNEYGKVLKEYIKGMYGEDKIIFTGRRQDINSLLSIADIFVLPTLNKGRMEGSPVALLEAMASGALVVASKISGIKDQLDGFEELMFEPGNDKELAEKILWGIKLKQEDKLKITNLLVSRVNEKYTVIREIKDHEELYLSVI